MKSWVIANLITIDGLGGLVTGVLILGLAPYLATIEGLPESVIWFDCAGHLLYGTCAVILSRQAVRSTRWLRTLSLANMFWLIPCIAMIVLNRATITPWGSLHLIAEGLYVFALGALEWRVRDQLIYR